MSYEPLSTSLLHSFLQLSLLDIFFHYSPPYSIYNTSNGIGHTKNPLNERKGTDGPAVATKETYYRVTRRLQIPSDCIKSSFKANHIYKNVRLKKVIRKAKKQLPSSKPENQTQRNFDTITAIINKTKTVIIAIVIIRLVAILRTISNQNPIFQVRGSSKS